MNGDGPQTHHHGLLAGVSAGAMGVLALLTLVLLVWHRVSGPIGTAILVAVWAVTAAVVGLVVAGLVYAALWVGHRARNPEMLAARVTFHGKASRAGAGVIPAPVSPPAFPSSPLREVTGGDQVHYHFTTAEAVRAALEAPRVRRDE